MWRRILGKAWPAMWLLHSRHDHDFVSTAQKQPQSHGSRDPHSSGGQYLPLHRVYEYGCDKMGDSQQGETQNRQQKSKNSYDEKSARKHMPLAPLSTEVERHESQHEIVEPISQLEAIFASIPDGVIVYDLKGKIRRINPAALTLFELASENLCIGTSYRQFLRRYKIRDENQQPNVLKDWPASRVIRGDTASGTQEDTVMMRVPSG